MADLADKLLVILERQRELYSEISSLQAELLKRLDDTNQMTLVMDLLARKNQLLDAIHTQIHESAPWVDEWVQKKDQMVQLPAYSRIESTLSEIEQFVRTLRTQDEEMIRRFEGMARPAATPKDQQSHSRNMLNAFRALR